MSAFVQEITAWMATEFAMKRANALALQRQKGRGIIEITTNVASGASMVHFAYSRSISKPNSPSGSEPLLLPRGLLFSSIQAETFARTLFRKLPDAPLFSWELEIATHEALRIHIMLENRRYLHDGETRVFECEGFTIVLHSSSSSSHCFAKTSGDGKSVFIVEAFRTVVLCEQIVVIDGLSYGGILSGGTLEVRIDNVRIDGENRDPMIEEWH